MDDSVQNLTFYAPIEKADDDQRMVYGYASTETVDSQGEIVKKDALSSALADYMKWANIREMHQPSAVGKTKKANIDNKGLYIAAKIVDDNAWKKVKEGVYNGFSIGGRVKQMEGNEIVGLTLSEISLVDRPANPDAKFDVFKAEIDEDLDKREFSTVERKDLASSGKALPDGSFPIVNVQDLKNAIRAIGRAKDPAKAKAHIKARARALGATNLLPDSWKADTQEDIEKAARPAHTMTGMAAQMRDLIDYHKTMGHQTGHMEDALEALKLAAGKELDGDEDYNNSSNPGMPMNMADTQEDIRKEDDSEEKQDSEDVAETPENATTEQTEEKSETDNNMEASASEADEKDEKLEGDKEVADTEEDIQKILADRLSAYKMPTEEEIIKYLKSVEVEADEKAISVFKFEFAGKILDRIQTIHEQTVNAEAAKAEAEKVKKETPVVQGDFKKVVDLLDKFETQYKKEVQGSTTSAPTDDLHYNHADNRDVVVPPSAPESPQSPATKVSEALAALQNAVKMLAMTLGRGALTGDEEDELENGVAAGSERTSQGRFNEENEEWNSPEENALEAKGSQKKADLNLTLQKMEKAYQEKIEKLEERIKTLESQPVPVKAKTGYATVEKFETNDKKAEYQQALKKADEVSGLLKVKPFDPELQKTAQSLQAEIMRLGREANASGN